MMITEYIIIPTTLGTKVKIVTESDYNNQKSPVTIEELIDSVISCNIGFFTLDSQQRDWCGVYQNVSRWRLGIYCSIKCRRYAGSLRGR